MQPNEFFAVTVIVRSIVPLPILALYVFETIKPVSIGDSSPKSQEYVTSSSGVVENSKGIPEH